MVFMTGVLSTQIKFSTSKKVKECWVDFESSIACLDR